MARTVLPKIIVILAIADGVIHLLLDDLFYHFHFFQNTTSVLFGLDFLGYIVLIALFVLSARFALMQRRVLSVVMICYAAAEIVMWASKGGPDPFHFLGYLAKAVEVVLIVLLIVHAVSLGSEETSPIPQGA